jgi:hypothetical protein
MEPHSLILTATILFALAAGGGLLMAGMRLRGTPRPPAWLAMGHGLLAAAGLTLLIYAACSVGVASIVLVAIGLFMAAALGGVVMNLLFHVKGKPLPLPLMAGHAALAVLAFALLLMHLYT